MKFQLLPLGARFEYQGRVYVKTGPLTATGEDGGARVIPRHATLIPLDATPAPAPKASRKLEEAAVMRAFDVALAEFAARLAEPEQTHAALAAAREKFRSLL